MSSRVHRVAAVGLLLFAVAALLVPLGTVMSGLGDPAGLFRLAVASGPVVLRTVLLAVAVAALSLPVAVTISRLLSTAARWVQVLGAVLCAAPVVLNLLVVILAWMVLLEHDGLFRRGWEAVGLPGPAPEPMFTTGASLLAMTYVTTPTMALVLLYSFRRIDPRMREAAVLLGAPRWRRLLDVELGYVAPALVTAFVIGYIISLNLYLIPEYLTGPELTTLGMLTQQEVIQSYRTDRAAGHSMLLLVVALVPVAAAFAAERRLARR